MNKVFYVLCYCSLANNIPHGDKRDGSLWSTTWEGWFSLADASSKTFFCLFPQNDATVRLTSTDNPVPGKQEFCLAPSETIVGQVKK